MSLESDTKLVKTEQFYPPQTTQRRLQTHPKEICDTQEDLKVILTQLAC